jgi:ATPase, P-type (transporting), HAD superfamily, subfamily IC
MITQKINASELKDLSLVDLYQKLDATEKGLKTEEAVSRSKEFGYNVLSGVKKQNIILKFLSYFKNPLILILIAASLISGLTGQLKNMIIILSMIFLSVTLNFYQEHKSSKAAEKISKRLAIKAKVLRDGKEIEIETKYIVPGDVIMVSAGDIIPADGKIISADDFFLNEASLTGESLPVEKFATENNVIFSGTNVISGYGRFLVTNIGLETEFGKIAQTITRPETENAFEKGIKSFGFLIVRVIAVIVSIIFIINAIMHKGFFDSFLFALAVAVGVTPELLPMIMSVNMAKGAIKMAKGGVLVKRLNSIPTFGSIDLLCTDKTGTLTEDKVTVIKHVDIYGTDSDSVFKSAYINGYFETGIKNILDKAILEHTTIDLSDYKKVEEIPYDFNRKRSSVFSEYQGVITMVTKGAPEELFKICSSYIDKGEVKLFTNDTLKAAKKTHDELSSQGFRILAIAEKTIKEKKDKYNYDEESNLILQGFMVFYDPPKIDVKETLVFMKSHGIAIKILTGDGPLITKKICDDLELPVTGIVTGDELDLNVLTDEEIYKKVKNATICARMSPSQKEKIIYELKRNGLIVGYLGDGINDAPSLKAADVGISVENAVDVAKETADIILSA